MRPNASLRIRAAGASLTLLPPGVVWWERERTLFAADLHVGMSETMQSAGMAVPTGGHAQDLEDLAALAAERAAARLVVLGDFLHAPEGATPEVAAMVAAWGDRLGVPVWLLAGNHDHPIAGDPGVWPFARVEDQILVEPFLLTHRHRDVDAKAKRDEPFRICGHLHPVVRLEGRGDRLRLRCFVRDAGQLILPAFGRMTGGAVVEPGRGRSRYPVTADEVFDLRI